MGRRVTSLKGNYHIGMARRILAACKPARTTGGLPAPLPPDPGQRTLNRAQEAANSVQAQRPFRLFAAKSEVHSAASPQGCQQTRYRGGQDVATLPTPFMGQPAVFARTPQGIRLGSRVKARRSFREQTREGFGRHTLPTSKDRKGCCTVALRRSGTPSSKLLLRLISVVKHAVTRQNTRDLPVKVVTSLLAEGKPSNSHRRTASPTPVGSSTLPFVSSQGALTVRSSNAGAAAITAAVLGRYCPAVVTGC